jgi:MFS transporter, DHA2 family, multidrug resistance protein
VLLSLAAILPFVYGFKEVARGGWHAGSVLPVVIGLLAGVMFVVRQRRLEHPLLDLRLFAIPAVSGALVLGALVAASQGGVGFFMAQHLQVVKGLSPLGTGLWVLVPTLALIVGIFVSQGIVQRVRPAYVLAVGLVVAAIGAAMLTQVSAGTGPGGLLIGFTVVYIGLSPVSPVVSQLVMPSAPPERAGSVSSLQSTSGELGVALGIAVLGSVGVAAYRSTIEVPAQIAGTAADAAARETIVGALAVAQSLPAQVAEPLVTSARAAFTSGLNAAAAVCVAVFVGLAVLAVGTLRHVPPIGGPGPRQGDTEAVPQAVERERSALAAAGS